MTSWILHPWEELSHFRNSLDEAFRGWSGDSHPINSAVDYGWKPRMDVCENKGFFKIILELPGFLKEDLDVQVNGRFLSIKGSKPEQKDGEWRYHRRERYSGGEFHRAIALPTGIDGTSIQAKFVGGVLYLSIPKTGGKTSQHISLMGKEEHSNRRSVIEAEERERQRRMEENDPMLSKSHWVAGRMGTVIDEERERQRRINENEEFYYRHSLENRRMTIQLENNERNRRVHDHRGEGEKKKNALRVSKMIKQAGIPVKPAAPFRASKLMGHGTTSGFRRVGITGTKHHGQQHFGNQSRHYVGGKSSNGNKTTLLEEQERRERMRDYNLQRVKMDNAKRVSSMIKQSSSTSSNTFKSNQLGSKNHTTSTMSFNKPHVGTFNTTASLKTGTHSNKFLNNLEEKERERRLKDKKGQMEAKKNAALISHMIGTASF